MSSTSLSFPAWRVRLAPVALLVLVTAIYARSAGNGFIYDDQRLIVEQPPLDSWRDVLQIFTERHWHNLPYYRPLARFTMDVQNTLHGDNPAPYHLLNAVLAGTAAVVAYGLLRTPALGVAPIWAWLAAGIFALHPVASSCVYPICSGRETLLPALFGTSAAWAFLSRRQSAYWLALALMTLALLCKEQAIIVPVVFVIADLLGLTAAYDRGNWRRWLSRYLPVATIVAFYLLVRLLLFGGEAEHELVVHKQPSGPIYSVLYAGQVISAPFVQLVYEPRLEVWFSWSRQVCCGALTCAGATLALRHRQTLGPRILFLMSWSLLALLPTANIFQQEARFAERYNLWSLLGIVATVAVLVSEIEVAVKRRRLVVSVAAAVLVACAAISWGRCAYFESDTAFLQQWLSTDREALQAHVSLGHRLAEDDQLKAAATHLQEAVRIRPEYAEAHLQLAVLYERRKQLGKAAQHYREVIRINPRSAAAHNNLGVLRTKQGRVEDANESFRQAIKLEPDYAQAHNNLAVSLAGRQQWPEAKNHFRRALEINPESVQAWYNLGQMHAAQGKLEGAAEAFKTALAIQPMHAPAHNEMGVLYVREGDLEEALKHFEHAVKLQPDYLPARKNVERARADLQRRE